RKSAQAKPTRRPQRPPDSPSGARPLCSSRSAQISARPPWPPWTAASGFQSPHLRLCPLQPEPHLHLAVHRRRGGEVLVRVLPLARAPVELAEAEVAVGNEGAHAARLGEGQCLTVVHLARLGIEAIEMTGDVAEEVLRMSRPAWATQAGQPLRLPRRR